MKSLLAAVAFLTRLPVGRFIEFDAAAVTRSAAWFPVVGLLLGGLYVLVAMACDSHLPAQVTAVLLLVAEALATGALHFDGLADTADGFGGGKTRDDILRIMRDHCIGSYGGAAIALLVILKVAAYAALLRVGAWLPAVVLTPAIGRWSILLLTASLPYARTTESVTKGMGRQSLLWGTLLLGAAVAGFQNLRAVIAIAVTILVSILFGLYCRRKIGGITGDTLGANLQLCESAALLTFLWVVHTQ